MKHARYTIYPQHSDDGRPVVGLHNRPVWLGVTLGGPMRHDDDIIYASNDERCVGEILPTDIKFTADGIIIDGFQRHDGLRATVQQWWCVPEEST